jgi:hypothetical protein
MYLRASLVPAMFAVAGNAAESSPDCGALRAEKPAALHVRPIFRGDPPGGGAGGGAAGFERNAA